MTHTIRWWEGDREQQHEVASASEVEATLTAIEARVAMRATLVTVSDPVHGSMSIGLGAGPWSVVDHVPANGEPPYAVSWDDADRSDQRALSFVFGGELSEYPPEATVALGSARECLAEFCRTGRLGSAVRWRVE